MRRVAVFLAEGFEEIEAVVPIDILRRGGVEVVVAGVGTDVVTGSHGITIDADALVEEIDINDFDGLILPGGLPGANNLAESEGVNKLLNSARDEGKLIAAICASPALVLSPLGILKNKKVTGYPGTEFQHFDTVSYIDEKVVSDGNFITSKGPGTAFDFALKILEYFQGKESALKIASAMLVI